MYKKFNRTQKFIWFPLLAIGFLLLGAWAVMLLWNAILPGLISGVGKITFLKSAGLLVLSRILFGGFKGQVGGRFRDGRPWKEKIHNMTAEEREKFKAEWSARCGKP